MSMSHVSGNIVIVDYEKDNLTKVFLSRSDSLPPLNDTLPSIQVGKSNILPSLSENDQALQGRKNMVNNA